MNRRNFLKSAVGAALAGVGALVLGKPAAAKDDIVHEMRKQAAKQGAEVCEWASNSDKSVPALIPHGLHASPYFIPASHWTTIATNVHTVRSQS